MMLPDKLKALLGTWGPPPDMPAKVAIAGGAIALLCAAFGRGRSLLAVGDEGVPRRQFLFVTAFIAALFSIVYISEFLHGGPRIVDATTYFLQGRALSHGDLAWTVAEPTASFRGRFLDFRMVGDHGVMGGIFPPGYPLLLAITFTLGAPMLLGPLLAAALVLASYRLARTVAAELVGAEEDPRVEPLARLAAITSVICAALRYHTADTMSHGATALWITLALDAALRRRALLAGFAVGAVVATRPVSAIPIGLVVLFLMRGAGVRGAIRGVLGALPGVGLLLLSQHEVTGSWLGSTQRLYYATSDGPPGCFRYGFGAGIGCIHEHGEFVAARIAKGFGPVEAIGTTLRRLHMHVTDVANFEPLALLVFAAPFGRFEGHAARATRAMLALVALQILAYAPFYFDGDYPGGGARFFADVLPIEHVLIVMAALRLGKSPVGLLRVGFGVLAFSFLGFGVHAAYAHEQLAAREGGRPMYEPDVVSRQNVHTGLMFIETDHGFSLGYDPEATVKDGIVMARYRGDDRDRMLYDALDHPPSYIYRYAPTDPVGNGTLNPWAPTDLTDNLHFETEAEWPPLSQTGGLAVPMGGHSCLSNGKALVLSPVGPGPASARKARAEILVPVPAKARYGITVRVTGDLRAPYTDPRPDTPVSGRVTVAGVASVTWRDMAGDHCEELQAQDVELSPPSARVVIEAEGGSVAVDRINLRKLK